MAITKSHALIFLYRDILQVFSQCYRGIGKLSMDVCTLVPCTCGITEDEGKRYCLPNLSVLKLCSLTAKTQLPSVSISFRALSKVYLRSVDAPAFDLFFKHLIFGDSPLTILSLATCQGLDRYNVAWPVTRSKTLRKLDLSWMALEQRTVHKILHRLPNTLVHIDFRYVAITPFQLFTSL